MGTNKPQVKAYITQESYEKIKLIADKENRKISNMLQCLIDEKIASYEKQNGTITYDIHHNNTVNINN